MDALRLQLALDGDLGLDELTIAERLALAHEVLRADVRRPALAATRASFVLPEHIERLYRGTSS